MSSENSKINAGNLLGAIRDLYKTKSSKINDDIFKTAFDEANTNGKGVCTQKLLSQIEDMTGVSIYDFSSQEQDAISATLNAIADDNHYVFDDWEDLNDISDEYLALLQENESVNNMFAQSLNNESINNEADIVDDNGENKTNISDEVENTAQSKTDEENGNYVKKLERKNSYALLVQTEDGYKVQIYTPKGKFVKERDVVNSDWEAFGLENPNKTQENSAVNDNSSSDSEVSNENTDNGNIESDMDSEDTKTENTDKVEGELKRVENDNGYSVLVQDGEEYKVQIYTKDGRLIKERAVTDSDWDVFGVMNPEFEQAVETDVNAKLACLTKDCEQKTIDTIASMQSDYEQATSKEGFFGKTAGKIKNFFNTKYSPENIQDKIIELAQKGDSATQDEIEEVQALVDKYCNKSGGGAEIVSNATAIAGGILGGIGIAAAVAATAPVSIPTIAVGLIGTAGAFLVGGLCKMATKQVEKNTDEIENNEFKGSDMAKDTISGGVIGASAYGIFKSIPAAVKSFGGAIGSGAKTVGDAVVSGGKAILKRLVTHLKP